MLNRRLELCFLGVSTLRPVQAGEDVLAGQLGSAVVAAGMDLYLGDELVLVVGNDLLAAMPAAQADGHWVSAHDLPLYRDSPSLPGIGASHSPERRTSSAT